MPRCRQWLPLPLECRLTQNGGVTTALQFTCLDLRIWAMLPSTLDTSNIYQSADRRYQPPVTAQDTSRDPLCNTVRGITPDTRVIPTCSRHHHHDHLCHTNRCRQLPIGRIVDLTSHSDCPRCRHRSTDPQ